jgi:hypothetical protein
MTTNANTIRQSVRGTADVTITLTGAEAEIALAALKFVSHLASGEGDDKDTEATAEVLDAYHAIGEQVYGAPAGLARWGSAVVDALECQLRVDVLAIIHRNFKQTKDGLSER